MGKFDVCLEEWTGGTSLSVNSPRDSRAVPIPEYFEADGIEVLRALEEFKGNLDALVEWIKEEMGAWGGRNA